MVGNLRIYLNPTLARFKASKYFLSACFSGRLESLRMRIKNFSARRKISLNARYGHALSGRQAMGRKYR
jgi:hypothetical protein